MLIAPLIMLIIIRWLLMLLMADVTRWLFTCRSSVTMILRHSDERCAILRFYADAYATMMPRAMLQRRCRFIAAFRYFSLLIFHYRGVCRYA